MNKRYALFSAAALLCACGSSFKPTYTPAAKGTTTGTAATQMIDGTGGTVTSSDGRLEVIVPAGMFTTATEVGIQPITNTAPNGVGVAYRLTPEGTTFSQPVTVKFHLDATQAIAIDSSFVVTQHGDGLWYSQPQQARDASTVSVPAQHFSDWAVSYLLLLDPSDAHVKVNASQTYKPTVLPVPEDGKLNNPSREVPVPVAVPLSDFPGTPIWEVNSTAGSDTVGYIAGDKTSANFVAPESVPNPAEVEISVKMEIGGSMTKGTARAVIAGSEIWTGTSVVTLQDGTKLNSTFTFAQTSDDGHGKVTFNVQSGTVNAVVPATLPNGCTQTATPQQYDIGPSDGMMTATYNGDPNDKNPMVAGMGTTVWLASYTTVCSGGQGSMDLAIQAPWWPFALGGPPPSFMAMSGLYDQDITANGATGHVTLHRQ